MVREIQLEDMFRGPLDLLLHLVKRDEIDIHDIPIASLTRDYLAEIDRMSDLDVEQASEFMALAAMLVEIKSRMLLPPAETGQETEDGEEDLFDPRADLVRILLEYKRFKEAAVALGRMREEHALRFRRLAPEFGPDPDAADGEGQEEGPGDLTGAGAAELLVAFQGMIRTMLSSEAMEIVSDEVPAEVRRRQLVEVLAHTPRTSFRRLLSDTPTKGEMVGFFIALMELIRQRRVRAWQAEDGADIHIARAEPEGPAVRGARHAARPARRPIRAFLTLTGVPGEGRPPGRSALPFPSPPPASLPTRRPLRPRPRRFP